MLWQKWLCVSEYKETNGLKQMEIVCLSEKKQLLTTCHSTGAEVPTRVSCLRICVCVPSHLVWLNYEEKIGCLGSYVENLTQQFIA